MNIGDRIKQRRIELELTVDELANRLGKNRATVYRYEKNDIKNMPTTVLEPLADALCTTPAYLMGWEEEVANNEGICPHNNADVDPQSWHNMKLTANSDRAYEEAKLIEQILNDGKFNRLALSYQQLTSQNRKKVVSYTEKLLDIQRLEEDQQQHSVLNAAHARTDITPTPEGKAHDDAIMMNPEEWE